MHLTVAAVHSTLTGANVTPTPDPPASPTTSADAASVTTTPGPTIDIEPTTSPTTSASATGVDSAPAVAGAARRRITDLDVLRGVALVGILLVNLRPVTDFGADLPPLPVTLDDPSGWLQLFVQQRFFPIFSVLFGIGFALLLRSAGDRVARPRLVLLRRLAVLLPLGAAHQLLHPGEALLPYATAGLVVLLPASWLPRWLVALGAVAALGAALPLGGGLIIVPGCFLLGMALVRFGVVDRIGTSRRAPAVLFAVSAAVSVPLALWQASDIAASGFDAASALAGVAMAAAYCFAVLALMATRARPVLERIWAPLGRMALTNYLTATLAMVAASRLLDLSGSRSWATLLTLGAVITAVQWVVSTLWLARFRQGPVEWLWRWVTWAQRPPFRTTIGDTP